ncbi:MAG TPA: GAF domain-containing sensor histidine kinase [Vicinamibacterales bacterium]|nr:GAF domain-containing sensor histidine kinase [Vicinamibacterales bacterium]
MAAPTPTNDEARLEAVRRTGLLDSRPGRVFDDFTALASYICGVPIALVTVVDRDRQWFKSKFGLETAETPREDAFCAHAIMEDALMVVPDAHVDQRFTNNPLVLRDPMIRFYAGAPLKTPDGFALGTLCVIDRVPRQLSAEQRTALQALARQVEAQINLRQALEDIAAVQKEKQQFVANVSHELRTPLTSLRASLTLLGDGGAGTLPAEAAQLVSVAGRNANRLLLLVNDILDYERLGSGTGLRISPTVTPLATIFDRAREVIAATASANGVGLQLDPTSLRVLADVDRAAQVLVNLLSNAVKYSPPSGIVSTHVEVINSMARVSVTDQGPGVPDSFRDRLFKPFQQVEGSADHRKPGTGLGLAISRGIVHEHGGAIGVLNRPDGGARFWFTLPLAK